MAIKGPFKNQCKWRPNKKQSEMDEIGQYWCLGDGCKMRYSVRRMEGFLGVYTHGTQDHSLPPAFGLHIELQKMLIEHINENEAVIKVYQELYNMDAYSQRHITGGKKVDKKLRLQLKHYHERLVKVNRGKWVRTLESNCMAVGDTMESLIEWVKTHTLSIVDFAATTKDELK